MISGDAPGHHDLFALLDVDDGSDGHPPFIGVPTSFSVWLARVVDEADVRAEARNLFIGQWLALR